MYAMTGLYAESTCAEADFVDGAAGPSAPPPSHPPRDSIKCHSRNPSAGICDRYAHTNFTYNFYIVLYVVYLFGYIRTDELFKLNNAQKCSVSSFFKKIFGICFQILIISYLLTIFSYHNVYYRHVIFYLIIF